MCKAGDQILFLAATDEDEKIWTVIEFDPRYGEVLIKDSRGNIRSCVESELESYDPRSDTILRRHETYPKSKS